MADIIAKHQGDFEKVVQFFDEELATIRTGRASAQMLDKVVVETYGTKSSIVSLASVSVPEPRTIVIEPWDKNVVKDIERALQAANLGVSPVAEGGKIRLNIPQLTEETRKELVKKLKEKLEKARVSLRSVREKAREEILRAEKTKEIAEDDRFALQKKLDEEVAAYNAKIEERGEKKEKEIMTV